MIGMENHKFISLFFFCPPPHLKTSKGSFQNRKNFLRAGWFRVIITLFIYAFRMA